MYRKHVSVIGLLLLLSFPAAANTYSIDGTSDIIGDFPGEATYTHALKGDTLLDIARRFGLGQDEILLANPTVDRWLPKEDTKVRLPTSYILPKAPRKGIVLNIAELRLYYFPSGQPGTVVTHPVSIGRQDWQTPLGTTRIVGKTKNPTWTPPESIKREHAEQGDFLPDVVPAGPDNPLGLYAMRLGIPGYLIHGTNKGFGVGMRVSHGCVRMYPEDIERLFPRVKIGTPVTIVNQPIKVGWYNDTLYIEIHPPLEEDALSYDQMVEMAIDLIIAANKNMMPRVDGYALRQALIERQGVPIAILKRDNTLL
ncbi:MAG: L,D-transpeptidase family protein [Pseudomonadota bacterium]